MKLPRPSQSPEWSICTGSHQMQSGYDDESGEAAMEGEATHEMAAEITLTYVNNMEIKTSSDYVGKFASNGVLYTDEMYQAAIDYVTDILKICNANGKIRAVQVEKTLSLDDIYPGMKGTPDAWLYDVTAMVLYVWDLKFGHGIVEVFENPQFILYVHAILNSIKIDGFLDQMITVKMRVVQPRAFHREGPVREWSVKANNLRGFINQLKDAARLAMSPDAKCIAGKWCRNCLAKHSCTTLQRATYHAMDSINNPTMDTLSGNNLSFELQLLRHYKKMLEYRLNGLEEQAEMELRQGGSLPGFKLEKSYGRKYWKDETPVEQVAAMGDLMGVELRKPLELITPTQAGNKGLDGSVIKMYSDSKFNGFKLVEFDERELRKAFRKDI